MTSTQGQFNELIALTELFLFQEYSLRDWKTSERGCYDFYKAFANSQRKQPSAPPPSPALKPVYKSSPPPPVKKVPPPPQEKKPEPVPSPTPAFAKQQREKSPYPEVEDFKPIIRKLYPTMTLIETPPSDTEATHHSQQWKEKAKNCDAIILSDGEHPEHHAFLVKVAIALRNHERHAEVIAVNNEGLSSLPTPTVVVASRQLLEKYPKAKSHFEQSSQLIVIPSITDTLKDPQQKRELWKSLCSRLLIQ